MRRVPFWQVERERAAAPRRGEGPAAALPSQGPANATRSAQAEKPANLRKPEGNPNEVAPEQRNSALEEQVERAIRGSMEQGLLTKPLRLEDIYYRTTLDT